MQNSYGALTCTMHGLNLFLDDVNGTDPQICYTDEGRYYQTEDAVRAYIESHLASGRQIGVDFLSVDLGQNDSSGYCN